MTIRTLRLTEWRQQPVELGPEELAELRGCGAQIRIQPLGAGSYDVQPESIVGSVTTEHLHVVIRPKFDIEQVFYMLAGARRFELLSSDTTLDARSELTEGFVRLYLDLLRPRLRRGLLKGYRSEEDSLQTIRGRIRTAEQLRRRFGTALPVEVQFDDYTEDIAENRLIKASLRRIAGMRLRVPALRARVVEALGAFELVTDQVFTTRSIPVFRFTRLNAHYKSILELAALVIRNSAVELSDGTQTVRGLLFDMNKIFEDFLFGSLRHRLTPHFGPTDRWLQGQALRLDEDGALRPEPDLSWWRETECLFVGDAKYKYTDRGKLEDLYQLLAYCTATNLPTGLLIYAEQPAGPTAHRIVRAGPVLRVTSIDVSAPTQTIENRLDDLAAHIRESVLARADSRARCFVGV